MTFHTPEDVRIYLAEVFRRLGATEVPELTADAAMTVVRPVLEERDREIEALNEQLAALAKALRDLLDMPGKDSSEEGERDA